jgi:hypothetical protein
MRYEERCSDRITNLGHRRLALEATPDPVINTLGLPPCLLHAVVTVGLVTPKGRSVSMTWSVGGRTDLNLVVRFLTILMAIADCSKKKARLIRRLKERYSRDENVIRLNNPPSNPNLVV